MKLSIHTPNFAAAALAAIAFLSPAFVEAQLPVDASNATPLVSGLEGPRGLIFGPDGALYIAEAGTGGTLSTVGICTQVVAPIGPSLGGTTARISKFLNGNLSVLASGLPSRVSGVGDVIGVADVAFLDGNLYALLGGGGCSHGNPTLPNGIVKVNLKSGKWDYITDLSLFVQEHPPAYNSYNDFEPDGVPYSMVAEDGALYVAEPNHAQIFKVTPAGATRLTYDYSFHFGDVTPTSIAFRDGNLYVGNLGIFPIRMTTERVTTLSKNVVFFDTAPGFQPKSSEVGHLQLAASRAGFTTIVSLKFGPDGLLYVLELSDAAGNPTPGMGKVVRVNTNGKLEDVVVGLNVPSGMTFGPDNALYISNWGAGGPGAILRIVVP